VGQPFLDVVQGRVRRALGNPRPPAGCELVFETVEQPVEQPHLALVHGCSRETLPQPCACQYGMDGVLGLFGRMVQGTEEPGEPLGDVEGSLVGALQDVVVRFALPLNPC